MINDIADLRKQRSELESQLYQMQTDFMINKSRIDDPQMIDMQVKEILAQDTEMMLMKQQLMRISNAVRMRMSGREPWPGGGAASLDNQIAQINQQIQQYEAGVKSQLERDRRTKPNLMLQQLTKEFQTNSLSHAAAARCCEQVSRRGHESLEHSRGNIDRSGAARPGLEAACRKSPTT